jgi:hypothetical protein
MFLTISFEASMDQADLRREYFNRFSSRGIATRLSTGPLAAARQFVAQLP